MPLSWTRLAGKARGRALIMGANQRPAGH